MSGANTAGGLVAASASLWNEVSTIQTTGSTNRMPTTQASRLQPTPGAVLRVLLCGRACGVRRVAGIGVRCRVIAAHRPVSSLNSDDTVRSANVAMMIVPMTTTTAAAEARP